MISRNNILQALLNQLLAANDPVQVAYSHNYLFDERVSAARQVGYENAYPPEASDLESWLDSHQRYIWANVYIPRGLIPEIFTAANSDALLTGLAEEQYVLRLERLDEALKNKGDNQYTLATLAEKLETWRTSPRSDKGQDALAFLEEFCTDWNTKVRRQNRPTFAAFYDELEDELGHPDWPNRLRNRLGLAHYNILFAHRPIPVALMRYRVSMVLQDLNRPTEEGAFAIPTVLDSEFNAHFFPAPRQAPYGRTLDLEPDPECERLVSEILHRRIDYRPEHIYKLGEVTLPIPAYNSGVDFARLRNGHLFCLCYESGINDFGAEIPEH